MVVRSVAAIALLLCIMMTSRAAAGSFDWRMLARASGWYNVNPDLPHGIYEHEADSGGFAVGRVVAEYIKPELFEVEFNAYAVASSFTIPLVGLTTGSLLDVERSGALSWEGEGNESTSSQAAIDRFALSGYLGDLAVTVGRQAINLGTCYYFTPNDFFAPFAAQTFYRVYKPGVDAIRLEYGISPLSQLTLVAVAGYEQDATHFTGWGKTFDEHRHSYLARFSTIFGQSIEATVIGGEVRQDLVIGGALQGSLGISDIGFRIEGHQRFFHNRDSISGDEQVTEFAFQVNRQFESTLSLTVEYYFHGAGSHDPANYRLSAIDGYLAREYFAASSSYEITPLLSGSALALVNLTDGSYSLSLYGVYSLSDEAEASLSFSLPVGKTEPEFSEFGVYPTTLSAEVRVYF